jgi:methyltransferase-like protein
MLTSIELFEFMLKKIKEYMNYEIESSTYESNMFGNFIISFTAYVNRYSIVLDRGQFFICDGFDGNGSCELIAESLLCVDKKRLLEAVQRAVRL